jgi:hypothetical protein
MLPLSLKMSPDFQVSWFQAALGPMLERPRWGVRVPPLGSRIVLFIDDLQLAPIRSPTASSTDGHSLGSFEGSPPVEFIRFLLERYGWFEDSRRKVNSSSSVVRECNIAFHSVYDISFVAAVTCSTLWLSDMHGDRVPPLREEVNPQDCSPPRALYLHRLVHRLNTFWVDEMSPLEQCVVLQTIVSRSLKHFEPIASAITKSLVQVKLY